MPNVTGLDPAKRRSGWIEIQLDGAPLCVLPQEDVWRLGLAKGDSIEQNELEALLLESQRAEAMRIGLRYLSVRPRSRREVDRRLRRDRLEAAAIEPTLDRLVELGYLDDADFAAAFARDRIRLRPCGVRRLRSDLLSRGVSASDAEAGIAAAMDEERVTEQDLLDRVAGKRAARLTDVDGEKAKRRLFAYLARRGFAAGAIRAWIDANLPEEDNGRP